MSTILHVEAMRMDPKGRVVLPAPVRRLCGWQPGDELLLVLTDETVTIEAVPPRKKAS